MTIWEISSRLGMRGTVTTEANDLKWHITTPATPDFTFGGPNMIPLVGDWDGNGTEGIGVYEPGSGTFFLKQVANDIGDADTTVQFGPSGLTPISWHDTIATHDQIGLIQGDTVYLNRGFHPGAADITTTTDNIVCYPPLIKQCTYIPPSYTSSRSSFSVYEIHPFYCNGTFRSITDKIPSIADLGIDVIYLMPIWRLRDPDVLWDVYSIKDYYDIDPRYGTLQELKTLIDTVHSHGMKILFDLVTVHATTGGIVYNNNWTLNISTTNLSSIAATYGWSLQYTTVNGQNVVYEGQQFDSSGNAYYNFYGVIIGSNVISFTSPYAWGPAVDRSKPEVVTYFTDVTTYYVEEYDIDGWRIDVPGNSYNSIVFPGNHSAVNLFASIIDAVKTIKPDAIFISEPTVPSGVVVDMEYVNLPFTGIMSNVSGVIGNTITSDQLVSRLLTMTGRIPLYVLESHDIPRLSTTYPLYDKNFMVLISTFYGSPFIQAGQEIGATNNWVNAQVDWTNGDYSLRDFYKKVLTTRKSSNAMKYGLVENTWKSGDNVYAYSMIYEEDKAVIILNFSSIQTTSTLNTPFGNGDIITDQLSGEMFNVTDPTNFVINVPAYNSRILMISPPVLTTITVSPSSASIASGGSQTFTAAPKDQYGNPITATIIWISSDPSVATVDMSGLVTGITEGHASIIASDGDTIVSNVSLIIVEAPPVSEAGMGGIGMIFLAGIGITALMSKKKLG